MALGFAVRLQPSSAEYANSLAANLHLSGRLVQALSWYLPGSLYSIIKTDDSSSSSSTPPLCMSHVHVCLDALHTRMNTHTRSLAHGRDV